MNRLTDTEILLIALCFSPLVCFAICAFWSGLKTVARERDTRRYPKYGQSKYMRENRDSIEDGR